MRIDINRLNPDEFTDWNNEFLNKFKEIDVNSNYQKMRYGLSKDRQTIFAKKLNFVEKIFMYLNLFGYGKYSKKSFEKAMKEMKVLTDHNEPKNESFRDKIDRCWKHYFDSKIPSQEKPAPASSSTAIKPVDLMDASYKCPSSSPVSNHTDWTSDHTPVFYKLQNQSSQDLGICSWNLLKKCRGRNNPWSENETDTQFKARLGVQIKFLQDLVKSGNKGIIALQEADSFSGTDEFKSFKTFLNQEGWDFVKSNNGEMVTLYNKNVLNHVGNSEEPAEFHSQGHSRALKSQFQYKNGNDSFDFYNLHLDFSKDYANTMNAVQVNGNHDKILVGDTNHTPDQLRFDPKFNAAIPTNIGNTQPNNPPVLVDHRNQQTRRHDNLQCYFSSNTPLKVEEAELLYFTPGPNNQAKVAYKKLSNML